MTATLNQIDTLTSLFDGICNAEFALLLDDVSTAKVILNEQLAAIIKQRAALREELASFEKSAAPTFVRGDSMEIDGTSLKGYVDISYNALVAAFGQPQEADGYKIDAQWIVRFSDGTIATIYDYKTGFNYNGCGGLDPIHNTDWHIGGKSQRAVELVCAVLGVSPRD